MYRKGDVIFYGNSGVYRIEEIGPIRHIRGYDPNRTYYKLSSVRRGETAYVPVDAGLSMRPVLTRPEAEKLLADAAELPVNVCGSRDPRVLREHYQSILDQHSPVELLRLIRSVSEKSRESVRMGKRLGKTDQDYKKRAETLLCEEISAAMDVDYTEAQELLGRSVRMERTG